MNPVFKTNRDFMASLDADRKAVRDLQQSEQLKKAKEIRKIEVEFDKAYDKYKKAKAKAEYEETYNPTITKEKVAGKMVEIHLTHGYYLKKYNVDELGKKAKELREKLKRLDPEIFKLESRHPANTAFIL